MNDRAQEAPSLALTVPADLLKSSSQARQTLLQHLRLLRLLHHRNKNQHRRSHWFRHFNNFRRALSNFCDVIGIDVSKGLSEETASALPDRKHANGGKNSTLKNNTRIDLNKQQHRAVARRKAVAQLLHWIDGGLAVKWYTAFTTVSSTPSFAPLGLVLLALLARVYTTLGITSHLQAKSDLEERQQQMREEEEIQAALEKFAQVDAVKIWNSANELQNTPPALPNGSSEDDIGVVVSRDDSASLSTKPTARHGNAPPASSMKPHALESPAGSRSASPISIASTDRARPAKVQYQSKIRSSPLSITPHDQDAPQGEVKSAHRNGSSGKKRKVAAIDDSDLKKSKKKKKPKNAIDALFAGLG